jgi:hypothetical protein
MNTKAETRTLEERLRAIEDHLEIYNLIASHPPSADTGADYFIRAIYAEDGAIDLAGGKSAQGNQAAAAMVTTPALVSRPTTPIRTRISPEATDLFLKLPISEGSKRTILWDNCARLYGVN